MATLEARAAEELARLQRRTRRSLLTMFGGFLAALLLALPAVWLAADWLMRVRIDSEDLTLRVLHGTPLVQQNFSPGPDARVLYFTVLGGDRLPVRSLRPSDIVLTSSSTGTVESFQLSAATSHPLDLYIALETSSSMAASGTLELLRPALKSWLRATGPGRSALITAGTQARVEQELEPDLRYLERALDRVIPAGEAALYDAVVLAENRSWASRTRKAMLLLADGPDTASKARLSDAVARARGASLPVFGVGIGEPADFAPLEQVCTETGGQLFTAAAMEGVAGALGELSKALSAQFRLEAPAELPRTLAPVAKAAAALAGLLFLCWIYSVLQRWILTPLLVVLGGPKHGLAVSLSSEILVCGSDPGCHVQVPGDTKTTAGRRFALERRGMTVSFHLLDPTGGTSVNRSIVESRDLVSGDVIRAGLARFLFFRYEPRRDLQNLSVPLGGEPSRVKNGCWMVSENGGPAFHVDGERTRVGREPDNDVVLEDPSVSRRHAELVMTGEGLAISDLGSRNGTYLGSSRVASQTLLHEGARLRFGRVRYTVCIGPPLEDDTDSEIATLESIELAAPLEEATRKEERQTRGEETAEAAETASAPAVQFPEEEARATPEDSASLDETHPTGGAETPDEEDGPDGETAGRTCSICGHANRPRARYCTQCGEKLS